MIWNIPHCDCCGVPGPGLKGRPGATDIRKHAKAFGWCRMEIEAVVRDICPTCKRKPHEDLVRTVGALPVPHPSYRADGDPDP